ncbi:MAG: hypothetical protein ACTSYM_12790 [Candidatus Baldrarchaeia archaeon]
MTLDVYIVVASINELNNLKLFKPSLENYNCELIIVDEGDERLRDRNSKLLQGLSYRFFGPLERKEWFRQHFGTSYERYLSVIPERCHAETSFGFLIAYEEGCDFIIELDDDVFPIDTLDLIRCHWKNLSEDDGVVVSSRSRWYRTIENLILEHEYSTIFPRGHPYSPETRVEDYIWKRADYKDCVLNMGLWTGHPDLDALTILYNGGLNGRCSIKSIGQKRDKVIVNAGTYFAICSMNTSFRRKIVPAFYQLYMNVMGIDRFDDIWSGLFVKKIADHLGDQICIGKPMVYHHKRARDTFKDLKLELEGMAINEILWRIVDEIEISGKDYYECYSELVDGISKKLERFNEKRHKDFIKLQLRKMRLWLDVIDRIE